MDVMTATTTATTTPQVKAERVYKRGQFIRYETAEGDMTHAIVVSNDTGNRFSKVLIVVECIPCACVEDNVVVSVKGNEYKVEIEKIKTISQNRVKRIMGNIPKRIMVGISQRIKDTYMAPEKRTFVYVKRVHETTTEAIQHSEQSGPPAISEQRRNRPALLLKWVWVDSVKCALVAYITTRIKKSQPTQIHFEKGEGGLKEHSVCMMEQLDLVLENEIDKKIGEPSPEKVNKAMRAFGVSLGLVRS